MGELEFVWVEDPSWRVLPAGHGKWCRFGKCSRPAVAALWRAMRRRGPAGGLWWPYCDLHLYGRRIQGDKVLVRVERP